MDQKLIDAVWQKGRIEKSHDETLFRKDKFGLWMSYNQYGNRDDEYGWEIDHIKPQDQGGTDDINNLQPLNWKNNAKKGNKYG